MKRSPWLVLATIASSVAYLALAILGEGGFAAFFAHRALAALAIVLGALLVAAFFTEGNLSTGAREDRGNRWIIAALSVIGLVDAWLPAFTDRKGFWTIDGETLRWVGTALFAVGGTLRLWPVFVLGRRFSGLVAIQPGHRLQTDGIYRVIRHPSYVGLVVMTLGWGLAFRAGAGILLAVLLVPPLLARIRAEERLLQSEFGADYDAYRRRSWRLVPGLF
jgi:protein-S-isoprenylcysteine O-methyltransferase Ste14